MFFSLLYQVPCGIEMEQKPPKCPKPCRVTPLCRHGSNCKVVLANPTWSPHSFLFHILVSETFLYSKMLLQMQKKIVLKSLNLEAFALIHACIYFFSRFLYLHVCNPNSHLLWLNL